MAQATLIFPPDFRWGTATSAYQVEGHNQNSDWWRWEQDPGHILDGERAGAACDWWENAEADLDLAAALGNNAHRLSLEWSRIEPEPGRFSDDALARYREILQAMHARGLEPMVTLHHFSNPLWLVEQGDFTGEGVVDAFRRYVERVMAALGELAPRWITINEPMVYVFYRYLDGAFPQGRDRGWTAALTAVRALLACHAAGYEAIKAARPEAEVGVAKNVPIFAAARRGPARWWARRVDWLFNEMWLASQHDGRLRWPIGRGTMPGLAGSADFIGLNYYTRFYVRFPPLGAFYEREWAPDAVVSDGAYGEVYPRGLFQVIKRALRWGKPIFITENGLPDKADALRPSFLLTHLHQVWRAINFNFPIMGYYHWTLVDNFEWERGWTQRFGLYELDRATGARLQRSSGALYGEICRSGSLSSDMTARYAPQLLAELFPG